jgi:hypothetical protein
MNTEIRKIYEKMKTDGAHPDVIQARMLMEIAEQLAELNSTIKS